MKQTIDPDTLRRYIEGIATAEEIECVVDWVDADPSHLDEIKSLHKIHNISLFNQPSVAANKEEKKKKVVTRKFVYEFLKVAAVFLLFWSLNIVYKKSWDNKASSVNQTFFVPAGQRAQLTLPDGSTVWLNAQTSITYPASYGKDNRIVKLNGEAYFNVKKDPERMFTVKTKDVDINVLGTEFNIHAYQDRPTTEIALINGSIELTGPMIPNKSYIMQPNDFVKIENGKLYASLIENPDHFKWKDGLICFTNESMESIFRKLELYYDTRIDVQKESYMKFRYTGKFRTKDGVEQILKVLQIEHKFNYSIDKDLNIITIK